MQYINTFLLSLSLTLFTIRAEILIDKWSRLFVPIIILESRHLIISRVNYIKDRSKQRNLRLTITNNFSGLLHRHAIIF